MNLISLSPNTEADDIRLAWRILFKPWLWRKSDVTSRAGQQLSRHLNHRPVVLVSSGRAALFALLKAYNIGAGDEIIIQAFTCLAVPAPIKWVGATPVYADISPQTYNLDPADVRRKITDKTKAVIIQHTFGIPGPVGELKKLAKENNLILIEDTAHALGATYHGQPVGTLGDAAFFSFGRDKTLSCVFGGAISSTNNNIINKIKKNQSELKNPPLIWIKQQLLHPILFSLILPLYFKANLGKILLVVFQKLGFLSKAVEPQEKIGDPPQHVTYKFPAALAYLLSNQLTKLDRYTTHRRLLAHTYQTAFINHPGLPRPLDDTKPAWLRFPLLVESPDKIHRVAKQQHILLGDWYNSPLVPADCDLESFGYQLGSCPQAEKASRQIINLPTHPRMTDEETHKIIKLINAF
ncbi:MAG: aminotransferase class I/II-fold pyridoxal phosphate-dependent enzyme [bacterium]